MSTKVAFIGAYSSPELISSNYLTVDIISQCQKAGNETIFITPNQVRGLSKTKRKELNSTRIQDDEYGKHLVIKTISIFERHLIFRTIRYLSFGHKVVKYFKKTGLPDYVFLWSYPPIGFLKKIVRFAKNHNLRVIFDVHDIQPEILSCNFVLKNLIARNTNYVLKNSSYIFALSDDMKNSLIRKNAGEDLISVISPWNYSVKETNLPLLIDNFFQNNKEYVVGYVGNIGNFQNIDFLVKLATSMTNFDDIKFLFVGSGGAYDSLVKATKNLNNVIVHPKVSTDEAAKLYKLCDLNLISLKKGLIKYCCPSKTPMILQSSKDILVLTDESSYSSYLSNHGAYVDSSFDVKQVTDLILKIKKNKKDRKIRPTIYEKENSLKLWYDFFRKLKK